MNNRTQQRFDRSIRDALAVKLQSTPRKNPVDSTLFGEPKTPNRRGWKLRLDPETGATVWGPKE